MVTSVKKSASQVIIFICLCIWAFTTVFPFVWVTYSSFKNTKEILGDTLALPTVLRIENYTKMSEKVNGSIGGAYMNSLIISGTVTIVVLLFASMAGYALGRYKFTGKRILQSLVIASMMIPAFATILPVFKMIFSMGLVSTPMSVILPQLAGNLSFAILILMGYIRGLPNDIEEAAYIEGCNVFQIFFRVVVPIMRPSLATVAIFVFLWSYNDLFTQLFFLKTPKSWAITRLLNEVSSRAGVDYGLLFAAVVIVVIPVLLVYMLLQKNIIKGMTAGAVKG